MRTEKNVLAESRSVTISRLVGSDRDYSADGQYRKPRPPDRRFTSGRIRLFATHNLFYGS